jgi:gliding motility-associated-like protein
LAAFLSSGNTASLVNDTLLFYIRNSKTEKDSLQYKIVCDGLKPAIDSAWIFVKLEHPVIRDTISGVAICEGKNFPFNGLLLNEAGYYSDTLQTDFGCDSIVTFYLSILPADKRLVYDTIYIHTPYDKNGFNLPPQPSVGDVSHTLSVPCSCLCDSLVILLLHIVCPDIEEHFEDTVCMKQPYTENGFDIPPQLKPGTITRQRLLKTEAGCDSMVILNLTINEAYNKTVEIFLEADSFVTIDGIDYDRPGIIRNDYLTIAGCDSSVVFIIRYAKDTLYSNCGPIIPDKFFTPNGDGVNDYWTIKNIEKCEHTVDIYDRFGKLLIRYKNNFRRWDGVYLGNRMPTTDYWYVITLEQREESMAGHFTLIR